LILDLFLLNHNTIYFSFAALLLWRFIQDRIQMPVFGWYGYRAISWNITPNKWINRKVWDEVEVAVVALFFAQAYVDITQKANKTLFPIPAVKLHRCISKQIHHTNIWKQIHIFFQINFGRISGFEVKRE